MRQLLPSRLTDWPLFLGLLQRGDLRRLVHGARPVVRPLDAGSAALMCERSEGSHPEREKHGVKARHPERSAQRGVEGPAFLPAISVPGRKAGPSTSLRFAQDDEKRIQRSRWRTIAVPLLLMLLLAGTLPQAQAHVGSKDVFEQVNAGPYRLFVTIRPPLVVPGVSRRSRFVPPDRRRAPCASRPCPWSGEASRHPPTPDAMARSAADPAFFTGSLWLMASGSWKVDSRRGRRRGVPRRPACPCPRWRCRCCKMDRSDGPDARRPGSAAGRRALPGSWRHRCASRACSPVCGLIRERRRRALLAGGVALGSGDRWRCGLEASGGMSRRRTTPRMSTGRSA